MFLFYVISFFKKGGTIQRGTIFKGGHYLRKCGMYFMYVFCKKEILAKTKFVCKVKYADSIYCFETRTNETTHYY